MKKRIFSGFLSAVLVLSLLPWSAMAADEQEPLTEQPQAEERQEQDPGVPVTLPADPETALPVAITLDPQEDEQEQETQPKDQPDQEPEQTPEQESEQDPADQPQDDQNDFQAPPPETEIPSEEEQSPETPEETPQEPETPEVIPEVLSQIQAAPVAQAEEHTHDLCGATHKDVSDHTEKDVTFIEWTDKLAAEQWESETYTASNSLPKESGNYYLNHDVELTANKRSWEAPDNTALCLNGHTIQIANNCSVISVGGSFELTDCKDTGRVRHPATGQFRNDGTEYNYAGSAVYVSSKGRFSLYNGILTDNHAYHGGGVYTYGTFNMYGGSITGNEDWFGGTGYGGGGVYVGSNGTFNLYAGTITENETYQNGAVWNLGTFNMFGGHIDNNKRGYGIWDGGGVFNDGTMTMTGGTICNNSFGTTVYSHVAGGVVNCGTMTLSGDIEISGNYGGSNTSNICDIYLGYSSSGVHPIKIGTGGLNNTDPVYIGSYYTPDKLDPAIVISANSTDYSGHFVSANSAYELFYDTASKKTVLRVPPHKHIWKYSADQSLPCILARCSGTGDDPCPMNNLNFLQVLSSNQPDTAYDGNPKPVVLYYQYSSPSEIAASGLTATIEYARKQSDGTYGAKTTDAPVNMGDYRATISAGGVSIYYDYTITPQRIAQPTVTVDTSKNYVYTGQPITPEFTVTSNDSNVLTAHDYVVELTDNVNAGTATLTLKMSPDGNYTFDPVSVTFTISKAAHANVTADGSAKYGMTGSVDLTACLEKDPQSVVLDSVADPDNVLVPNTMVVGLKTLDFTFQNDKDLVGKTVDVVLKVTDANYMDYLVTITLTVNDKTIPTVTEPKANALVYNASAQGLVQGGSTSGGTLLYRLGTDGEYSQSFPSVVNAGDYTVYYKVQGDDDFTDVAERSLTVTIAKRPATVAPKAVSLTKGADLPTFQLAYTGLVGGDVLTPSVQPVFACLDKTGAAVTKDSPAGTYTITWTNMAETEFSGADNYQLTKEAAAQLTITVPSSGSDRSDSAPTYPVTTPSGVDSSKKAAAKGDVVIITVKPEAGYVVKEVLVTDAKGNQIKVTAKGNSVFTFVQPDSQVDIQAVYTRESTPFQDVTWSDYFYDAVTWAKDNNVTGGVGNDLFGADRSCTRAQIVTFLWRAAGSPEPKGAVNMTDVPADAYYAKAVAWAIENGVTSGTGAGRFSPDATCTRAQGVTFLYRAAGSPAVTGSAGFQDVSGSDYFAAAVAWAKANDITDGVGNGLFGSKNSCTRAQIVTFLYRVFAEQ